MPVRRKKTSRPSAASVVRITEATGESPRSWDSAVAAAVKAAEVNEPVGVEVARLWAELDGDRLSRYHAAVKVAYREAQRPAGRSSR